MKLKAVIAVIVMLCWLFAAACGGGEEAPAETPAEPQPTASESPSPEAGQEGQTLQPAPTPTPNTAQKFTGTYTGYNNTTGLMTLYLMHESSVEGVQSPLDRQAAVYDNTPIIDAQTGAALTASDLVVGSKLTTYLTPLKSTYQVPLGRAQVIFANIPQDTYQMPVYMKVLRVSADDDGDITVLSENKDMQALIPKDLPVEVFGADTTVSAADIKEGDKLLIWLDPAYYPPMALAKKVIMLSE